MIYLSELDRQRFGHRTAKVDFDAGEDVAATLRECTEQQVQLLIARCSTERLDKVQEMERHGFFLTDTLVYWRKDRINAHSEALPGGFAVRSAVPEDAPELERIAARVFHHYPGHYHADPRLDKARCDEVYSSWAANACRDRDLSSEMILITSHRTGEIAGFAALKRCNDHEFDGTLYGVAPAFQGQGLFRQLLQRSQQWGLDHGFTRMLYSTQITNVIAQKSLARQGFEPLRSLYTLHKWLA
jgi:GNAT superfamily N-acetyltransferase